MSFQVLCYVYRLERESLNWLKEVSHHIMRDSMKRGDLQLTASIGSGPSVSEPQEMNSASRVNELGSVSVLS